jgi:1,4-alpha-glucan branching enzyme
MIEIKLFAPTINEVFLKGDFLPSGKSKLQKDEKGYHRGSFDLQDGKYFYIFELQSKSWFVKEGELVLVPDPYGKRIDDASGYTLIEVRNGKLYEREYSWRHDDKPLVPNNKLVIYETHVNDFTGGEADSKSRGEFKHVIEKLPYLKELGVTALELLPVMNYPGDYSWGYTPRHYFSIQETYGDAYELKRLVDEAHGAGMRVILDVVYNHASVETPLTLIDHDYWFHHSVKDPENSWGSQFNYEHVDPNLNIHPAREFIKENMRYWIEEFHIDGFRFDAVRQIDSYEGLNDLVEYAKKICANKPFINIGEHLPETPQLVTPGVGPMDSCWQDQFSFRLKERLYEGKFRSQGEIKEIIKPLLRGFPDCTSVINYLSNHDHNRSMPVMAKAGVFDDGAFARAHLAATILITSVGIPMIWMGEEFAEYKKKTMEASKIDWQLLKNEPNRNLFNHYANLIRLRLNSDAFGNNNLEFFHDSEENGILGFVRWSDGGARVIVLLNLRDVHWENYEFKNFPAGGEWVDWISKERLTVESESYTCALTPFEGKVLTFGMS